MSGMAERLLVVLEWRPFHDTLEAYVFAVA